MSYNQSIGSSLKIIFSTATTNPTDSEKQKPMKWIGKLMKDKYTNKWQFVKVTFGT